ncbi:transcriptional regulator ATRX homolog [Selaginella moellendorffii]|uniref:transcriptional regulator ATRX homolog n=1 Tax=Selaginella moellendorffii TaxID=88036 RepID=UPI000D1C3982|nr:transcriptional regulator ATRX homolog [Selaginella moellendorffii]|eukprot:XP_024536246.1 transcriptional regulator ATRX homolog [Selaginella moellendorffii]
MDARKESDSSPSSSDYSSEDEESRRKRRHKDEKRKHRRKSARHSSSGSSSDNDSESDGGRKNRRKDRKKRSRRRHHSSTSDDEKDGKRVRDDDSEEEKKKKRRKIRRSEEERGERRRKRSKRHDYSSSDDESSSESESERRKKKKLLKEAKRILKDHKASAKSDDQRAKKVETITMDDYYAKNPEFATWLKENRGLYFSSLSAEETRKLFSSFADAWNSGKLADKYYQGIKAAKRTNHKWNIGDDNQVDEEDERLQKRKKEKAEQKKFVKEHELVMDELLPKATGKDRLLEKKAIQREKNRNRDLSPEPMRETDLMGGGDDFKMMLARERARREKRANVKVEALQKKLSVVEERETAAMDQFRALINTSGGKITIPKRGT